MSVASDVEAFLSEDHLLRIGGERRESAGGQCFDSIDPATEKVLATVSRADVGDVDAAVTAARAALAGPWGAVSPRERQNCLLRLANLVERDSEWFAHVDSLDTGKPINEVRFFDIPFSIDVIRYMAGWATKLHGQTIELSFPSTEHRQFHAYTLRNPIGVVAAIVPWNFPLMMAVKKLAPALAAGCTVILKPAEQTPLSALKLADLCIEAGFPGGVVNVLNGFGEDVGQALATHPGIDKITFTGSIETGKAIVRAAAGNLKKVSLELGGKAPLIVFADADVADAARTAVTNAFQNQGESCIAATRLYVHESVREELSGAVAELAQSITVGSGLDPASQMGPVITEEHFRRVLGFIERGQADGAHIAAGGCRVGDRGYFIAPTLLTSVADDMAVAREEIFGPVLSLIEFDDEQRVLAAANSLPYGLGASVWTTDSRRAQRMSRGIESGMVWVNCYGIADAALPFGGTKQSGWGRETCAENVLDYTEAKVVVESY